jgi:type IV pilus assembly protein PilF
MSWMRALVSAGFLGMTLWGLSACSTSASKLDTLTQAEPDATRQRAIRRLSLASAYFEQNQNDVAQQEVRAALQIDPQFADAYSLLGLIHQRDNAPVLAQQSFEHAIQLASISPVNAAELSAIQHNYGWFLCQQNRFAEAQSQFERAVSEVNYRQADKTRKAIELCQVRAGMDGQSRLRNTEILN